MEGGEIFESMDSLWFYSSVFLRASSSKHKQSERAEELQLQARPRQQQDSAETHRASSGSAGPGPGQAPRCVKEAAAQTERRAAAAGTVRVAAATTRGCREWDERMVAWQREQRRRTRVAAAARCSQAPMPATGEGVAMKAHLRSWAHAVACSVR
ncbi:hypothetical protein BS78_03G265000 [Paspalum vaginatum]|nr:hypothetical protein BS78_03G265000 [Paspalum vaginatum]